MFRRFRQPLASYLSTGIFIAFCICQSADLFAAPAANRIPAFPGAEGAGSFARGGRGGRVIEVTNLQDNGPGSLRAAIETAGGPRVVVFRLSGIIALTTPIVIDKPFLTIAGQTAPGDGICIRGNTITINANEVIVRNLRFQRGEPTARDPENIFVYPATLADDRAEYRTVPAPTDSDHDGMPDAWERAHGFNPENPADGAADADKDGYTNLEEYLNGTEPRKKATAPKSQTDAHTRLAEALARHVDYFNAMEPEPVVNLVPNSEADAWLLKNVPLFECPDADTEEIYYFRWWALRKHLRRDKESGRLVFTEFIQRERPISSALGLHVAEMRWMRDQTAVNDYVLYWLRGNNGKPADFFHKYSQWLPWTLLNRAYVTGDTVTLVSLLDELVADHRQWEKEQQLPNGLFWQFDVRDAMEESISGSRTDKNTRPTINSYMFGSARAIAAIARLAKRYELATEFDEKAATLKHLTLASLWDKDAKFFKVRLAKTDALSDAREAIGFIPWYFEMPDMERGYEDAWKQLLDPAGFNAPRGITTAERRSPRFRSHGIGTCEWDGALWPYATSQTLAALANVVRDYPQKIVTKADYFDAFITYTRSHRFGAMPYIGEYQDEVTGVWLKGNHPRSSWYNHSTYADALISGVIGLRPRADNRVVLEPLIRDDAWAWFCIEGIQYHEQTLTILWDRDGTRYGRGAGFSVFADEKLIAHADKLERIQGDLP